MQKASASCGGAARRRAEFRNTAEGHGDVVVPFLTPLPRPNVETQALLNYNYRSKGSPCTNEAAQTDLENAAYGA